MCAMLFNRDPSSGSHNTCDSGYSFYRCDAGFVGCCAVDPCDMSDCPADKLQPTSTMSSDSTSITDAPDASALTTETDLRGTSTGLSFESSFSNTISTEFPSPSISSSSLIPLISPTLSSSFLPTPTTSGDTTTATNIPQDTSTSGDAASISTAAIVGICIGGTAALMLLLLVVGLLVRRQCIARRYAAADAVTAPGPYAEQIYTMDGSAPWKGVSELP